MDISKASNFERFVFDLLDRDAALTRELFGPTLARDGVFALPPDRMAAARERFGFVSGKSTHADRLATIRETWASSGVLIDTHTADGLKVARQHMRSGEPMIVLETALPAKFAETIREALGADAPLPPRPPALHGIEALPRRFSVMAADTQAVKDYIAQHAK
jgi:threonine synthase